MIKIAISVEAYEAIVSTLPLGSVAVEPELDAKGERHVWLDPTVINRLRALRGPGIMRIAGRGDAGRRESPRQDGH